MRQAVPSLPPPLNTLKLLQKVDYELATKISLAELDDFWRFSAKPLHDLTIFERDTNQGKLVARGFFIGHGFGALKNCKWAHIIIELMRYAL